MMRKFVLLTVLTGIYCSNLFGQKAATILDHKDRIRFRKMSELNSSYRETNLSITPDGRYLYFVSFRGGQAWSNSYMQWRGDSLFDGDIWFTEKVNGNWSRPQVLPYGINTHTGEDEPNISPDGRTVYYQSWLRNWEFRGGPYYKVSKSGNGWGRPQGLGGGITNFYLRTGFNATDGMTMSSDQKTFIVATGKDYNAPMDLYFSQKTSQGWTYCKRLAVSTLGDERSVFLAGDGKTLYFASDGYDGYGGLDIFKTTIQSDGSIGEVINIGKPFNTPKDDYGFILTADGNEAYFIRDGNIYFADLKEADERIKPSGELKSEVKITLKGSVKERQSWKGLQAQVVLLDKITRMPIKNFYTDKSGNYSIELPNKNKTYLQVVNRNGYLKETREIKMEEKQRSFTHIQNYLLDKDPQVEEEEDPPFAEVEKPENSPEVVTPAPEKEALPKTDPVPTPEPTEETVEPEQQDPYNFENVAQNHLILLLDVSESMNSNDRLPLLKDAFTKLLGFMRKEDRISVIIYSGEVRVVLENLSAGEKERIATRINTLKSGGSTLGQSGLRRAYDVAANHYVRGGNNRIIMATDGEFSIERLFPIAEANARRKIALSVFSFEGKNQVKLQTLAKKGGGNYSKINSNNIEDALLKEAKAVRTK